MLGPQRSTGAAVDQVGWLIIDEPELHLGPHTGWCPISPAGDARVCRTCPRPPISRSRPTGCAKCSPQSTERLDRSKKLRIYAEHGVRPRLAGQYRCGARSKCSGAVEDGHWTLVDTHTANAVVRVEPFEAIELELGLLWEDDAPSASHPG